ncbi:hypothetical protein PPL_10740 [Heterostelium album PN500]|uniref:KANL3/Tex30 alpha/beta hydrolase-like domain-containing protein n=1 Tax=Heterostelium pallidum (strain ATCC 26659 / Pp 5 / PN500) TaxID=670386 RepID=D3BSB4_HETP5|nr:hypothetical protein PPL_10740 [Heterostelium album PN500]EFA75687.1 hypothetical protein PPL_10740 [Heterostelium album PN500]|eukprot:XP_020427821.1 hypothetical protein PPL_10740 [Heterostelium album PN500]
MNISLLDMNQQDEPLYKKPIKVEKKLVHVPVLSEGTVYQLDGFLSYVDTEHNENHHNTSDLSNIGVVITHPHPMLGGNYNNNVVLGISSFLTNHLHIPTLCFNFRGVGGSQGKGSWRGSYEREDVLAAVSYLLDHAPIGHRPTRIIIVGYSYGAVIGSSVADSHQSIIGYTSVSYPFGPLTLMLLGPLLELGKSNKPKLFIQGDRDNFTGTSKYKSRTADFPHPTEVRLFENVDHFYGGREKLLAKEISKWICTTFTNLPKES